jgi:hypothetical protein
MPRRRFRALALLALPLLAACEDSPTAPPSYAQVVAGETWVAVAEPGGMAVADTWLPYAAAPAAAEARELGRSAVRARRAGRISEALELEGRALLLAAGAVDRAPPPERLLGPLAALDAWQARAAERLAAEPHPHLAESAAAAQAGADSARLALADGDTSAAVLHLSRAALAAREHAPMAVGARLLAALEARIDGAAQAASLQRARHLLAGAREGMATGDTVRALRRVVYAHQLLDAGAVDPAGTPR